jgi:hypothetical protein
MDRKADKAQDHAEQLKRDRQTILDRFVCLYVCMFEMPILG